MTRNVPNGPDTQGYRAFKEGRAIYDNPWKRDTKNWHEWRNGWQEAQDDADRLAYGD